MSAVTAAATATSGSMKSSRAMQYLQDKRASVAIIKAVTAHCLLQDRQIPGWLGWYEVTSESPAAGGVAALTRVRQRTDYNDAERQFSVVVQARLQEVLEGKRNALQLLRKYPADPDRLGIMTTPPSVPRDDLRLPVVESLTWEAVKFVCADSVGGPVSQEATGDGAVLEFQMFSTKFPHIVIERIDRYVDDGADPVEITWCLKRVQNQRAQTQVNRLLDAANLAFELLRMVR